MTLKNIDEYTVTVRNRQINNGEIDYITESGNGSLRIKDGKYYIMYKPEGVTVMIRIDGNTLTVTRTGDVTSRMEYILGKETRFMYNTPYGAMEMELVTNMLAYTIDSNGGEIHLKYDLCQIENNMDIYVIKKD